MPFANKQWKNSEIVFRFIFSVLILTGLVFWVSDKQGVEKPGISVQPVDKRSEIFSDLFLEAEAALVYDWETDKILFAKNPEMPLPLASLTKIMTALVASEKIAPEQIVEIPETAIKEFGDDGFFSGEKWRWIDLLNYTLVTSSNDGARALALAALPDDPAEEIMNRRAKELDLTQTYFTNPTGLDYDDVLPGAYSSAFDLKKLLTNILITEPALFAATAQPAIGVYSVDRYLHTGRNTNILTGKIPGLLFSKTGFTETAGGNLVVAFDRGLGQVVIAIVLNSSADGRFSDMANLVDRTMTYFSL